MKPAAFWGTLLLLWPALLLAQQPFAHGPLTVSANKRYLVHADGTPFFYLGDTAWELFHRLNRDEADRYLKRRAEQGFTVIQAVALAELNGLNDPNPYGNRPLTDNDPAQRSVLCPRRLHHRPGGGLRAGHWPAANLGRQSSQK